MVTFTIHIPPMLAYIYIIYTIHGSYGFAHLRQKNIVEVFREMVHRIIAGLGNYWETMSPSLPSGKLTWPWKITIFNGKIHYKLPFSIAMLVYQRVKCMSSQTMVGFVVRHPSFSVTRGGPGSWRLLIYTSLDWFLGEHLNRKPWFLPLNMGVSWFFSRKPSQ